MQFSYLDKNILLRLIVLVIADIELFWYVFSGWSVFIARHNLPLQIGAMTIMTICAYLTVKSLRQFIHGFEGEMKIKKILSTLPKTYHIYYDLNLINRGNIDATVIGPTGIWTIEVKSHTGKITFENNYLHVNGYQQKNDFLAQAYAEAMTLKDYISARYGEEIQVHPVLVFSSYKAYMRFGEHAQKGVFVIGGAWLTKLIRKQRETLNANEIQQIVSIVDGISIEANNIQK